MNASSTTSTPGAQWWHTGCDLDHADVCGGARGAPRRVFFECAGDRPAEVLRDVRPCRGWVYRLVLQVSPENPHALAIGERGIAANALEHQAAECVDIRSGADLLATYLFGG